MLAKATAWFAAKGEDVHDVFELVNANQADVSVEPMCRMLKVSVSGFYEWRNEGRRVGGSTMRS